MFRPDSEPHRIPGFLEKSILRTVDVIEEGAPCILVFKPAIHGGELIPSPTTWSSFRQAESFRDSFWIATRDGPACFGDGFHRIEGKLFGHLPLRIKLSQVHFHVLEFQQRGDFRTTTETRRNVGWRWAAWHEIQQGSFVLPKGCPEPTFKVGTGQRPFESLRSVRGGTPPTSGVPLNARDFTP